MVCVTEMDKCFIFFINIISVQVNQSALLKVLKWCITCCVFSVLMSIQGHLRAESCDIASYKAPIIHSVICVCTTVSAHSQIQTHSGFLSSQSLQCSLSFQTSKSTEAGATCRGVWTGLVDGDLTRLVSYIMASEDNGARCTTAALVWAKQTQGKRGAVTWQRNWGPRVGVWGPPTPLLSWWVDQTISPEQCSQSDQWRKDFCLCTCCAFLSCFVRALLFSQHRNYRKL